MTSNFKMAKNEIFYEVLQKITDYQKRNPLEFNENFKLKVEDTIVFENTTEFHELELRFSKYSRNSVKIFTTIKDSEIDVDFCIGTKDQPHYVVCYKVNLKKGGDWNIDNLFEWRDIKEKDTLFEILKILVKEFGIFKSSLLRYIAKHVSWK